MVQQQEVKQQNTAEERAPLRRSCTSADSGSIRGAASPWRRSCCSSTMMPPSLLAAMSVRQSAHSRLPTAMSSQPPVCLGSQPGSPTLTKSSRLPRSSAYSSSFLQFVEVAYASDMQTTTVSAASMPVHMASSRPPRPCAAEGTRSLSIQTSPPVYSRTL